MSQKPQFLTSTSHLLPSLEIQNAHWLVRNATQFLIFLHNLGPQKTSDLRSLRICPHAVYKKTGVGWLGDRADGYSSGPEWRKLLNKLADEATNLEYVYVFLDEEGHHSGAGRDVGFVKALGRLKVSRKMELVGMFAKGWPEYLEEKIGMPVWSMENESEYDLRRLMNYQRSTEGQIS
ncbi:hypothetical protein F5884DRAFT_802227 [Xylogone sp. PMI_703]|nr:hypothetical protein F5884DRAFT_802227 [Xylogone sp. PMI_703]